MRYDPNEQARWREQFETLLSVAIADMFDVRRSYTTATHPHRTTAQLALTNLTFPARLLTVSLPSSSSVTVSVPTSSGTLVTLHNCTSRPSQLPPLPRRNAEVSVQPPHSHASLLHCLYPRTSVHPTRLAILFHCVAVHSLDDGPPPLEDMVEQVQALKHKRERQPRTHTTHQPQPLRPLTQRTLESR